MAGDMSTEVPRATARHRLERRQTAVVAAYQAASEAEERQFLDMLGISADRADRCALCARPAMWLLRDGACVWCHLEAHAKTIRAEPGTSGWRPA
jgi:hypothetical protein